MLNRYNLNPVEAGYVFTTITGDQYFVYFTSFTLQTKDFTEIETVSFGFECKINIPDRKSSHDPVVKNTIVHCIKNYFTKNDDNALLYICLNNDEKGKLRNFIFSSWFDEFGDVFERYKSGIATENSGFFSSIILKKSNPNKQVFIDAFYATIDYWFPEE